MAFDNGYATMSLYIKTTDYKMFHPNYISIENF